MRPYVLIAADPDNEKCVITVEVFDLDQPVGSQSIRHIKYIATITPAATTRRLIIYLNEVVRSVLGRLVHELEEQRSAERRRAVGMASPNPAAGQPYVGRRHGLYLRE